VVLITAAVMAAIALVLPIRRLAHLEPAAVYRRW
jgi:hypothetical protein